MAITIEHVIRINDQYLDAIAAISGSIRTLTLAVLRTESKIMAVANDLKNEIAELRSQVERNTTVNASAVALLKGLRDSLDSAIADDIPDDEVRSEVRAVIQAISANTDVLAAAVESGTSSASAHPTAPAQPAAGVVLPDTPTPTIPGSIAEPNTTVQPRDGSAAQI